MQDKARYPCVRARLISVGFSFPRVFYNLREKEPPTETFLWVVTHSFHGGDKIAWRALKNVCIGGNEKIWGYTYTGNKLALCRSFWFLTSRALWLRNTLSAERDSFYSFYQFTRAWSANFPVKWLTNLHIALWVLYYWHTCREGLYHAGFKRLPLS